MKKTKTSGFFAIICAGASLVALQACEKKSPEAPASGGAPSSASLEIIPSSPSPGTVLRAVATGGDGLALRWERNGEALESAAETLDTAGFKKGDRIRLVAGHGDGIAAETVLVNSLPVIRQVSFKPALFVPGQDIHVEVGGWDPDGDEIRYEYEWSVNGEELYSESGPVLSGNSYKKGDEISVRITPRDNEGEGAAFEARAGAARNTPPSFSSVPPIQFTGKFIYKPQAIDQDGDAVSISVVKGPEGMTADKGTIEWNAGGHKGAFEVIIAADDGNGGQALQTFELKVAE